MKTASTALIAFLNAARSGDATVQMADCFTFILANGAPAGFFTNWDIDIAWNGQAFLSGLVLVQGLKLKCAVGLEVDRQQITIAAWPGTEITGNPWMNLIREGAFDGATVQRDRVFMSPYLPGGIDGLTLFKGRVATVDSVGRTSAKVTVASPLIVLDYSMPRNIFQPTCLHTLYDSGCTLMADDFSTWGHAGPGSTQTTILGGAASANHVQGSMVINSGLNAGVRATVRAVNPGVSWTLMYPLPSPVAGDGFTVYFGCDHTFGTCGSRFGNGANFRGFPNVPPPDYAV